MRRIRRGLELSVPASNQDAAAEALEVRDAVALALENLDPIGLRVGYLAAFPAKTWRTKKVGPGA